MTKAGSFLVDTENTAYPRSFHYTRRCLHLGGKLQPKSASFRYQSNLQFSILVLPEKTVYAKLKIGSFKNWLDNPIAFHTKFQKSRSELSQERAFLGQSFSPRE